MNVALGAASVAFGLAVSILAVATLAVGLLRNRPALLKRAYLFSWLVVGAGLAAFAAVGCTSDEEPTDASPAEPAAETAAAEPTSGATPDAAPVPILIPTPTEGPAGDGPGIRKGTFTFPILVLVDDAPLSERFEAQQSLL